MHDRTRADLGQRVRYRVEVTEVDVGPTWITCAVTYREDIVSVLPQPLGQGAAGKAGATGD
jgi:hypothetical protein